MTDDDKALVKRLRAGCLPMKHDAADRIEAQAAEIERLRGKLREIEDMCPVTCDMSVAHAMADVATEALEGKAEL